MKSSYLLIIAVFFCSAWLFAASVEPKTIASIKLSPSNTLVVQRLTERHDSFDDPPAQFSLNTSVVRAPETRETYTISLKTGGAMVEIVKSVFEKVNTAPSGIRFRFGVYAAVMEGDTIRFVFRDEDLVLLGTARVDGSGHLLEHHRFPFPEDVSEIQSAQFINDKEGKTILRVSEAGRPYRAFQFDAKTGLAFRVPYKQEH